MTPLVLAGAAFAGVDAHGLSLPVADDAMDPLAVWRPEVQTPLALCVGGTFEAAGGLLSLYEADSAGALTETGLLKDLATLNVGVGVALHRRVAVAAAIPVWLTSGGEVGERQWVGTGDTRISAPIGLILPKQRGFGLAVVPRVDVPSGDVGRYLGTGAFSGGGVLAVGTGSRVFQVVTNIGLESRPADADLGTTLLGAVAGTWSPSRRVALHLEGVASGAAEAAARTAAPERALRTSRCRTAVGLDCGDVADAMQGSQIPAEVLLDLRWSPAPGVQFTGGGALGLTDAVGAPTWRGLLGLGWAPGKETPDRSTTTGKLTVDAEIDDLSYDGAGTGGIVADVAPAEGLTVRSLTWLDLEGRVLGHGVALSGLRPGPYTLEVRYKDGGRTQTERHVFDVGYDVFWRPGAGRGLARSYNLAAAGEDAWVEIASGTGAVGLARASGWPADAPDVGWSMDARTDGAARSDAARLRVKLGADGAVTWSEDRAVVAEATGAAGSAVVAVAAVEGERVVTRARASFGMRVGEPGDTVHRFVDAAVIEVERGVVTLDTGVEGPWTLRVIGASGELVETVSGAGRRATVELGRAARVELVTGDGVVWGMAVRRVRSR